MVEQVAVDVDVVHLLAYDDLLRVGSQRLLVLCWRRWLLRSLARDAQVGEGGTRGLCLRLLEFFLEFCDAFAERLADLLIDEADDLADGLVELSVDEVHVSVETRGDRFYLLVGSEDLASIEGDVFLHLPQGSLDLLHSLVRSSCFCRGLHGFLEQRLHFLPHAFLALMDQL